MQETRRGFVLTLAIAAGALALLEPMRAAQNPPTPPPPPQPGGIPNPAEIHRNPQAEAAAKRARLQQNEKEFRSGVEKLYELAGELREEVQKTPTTDVLSLHMVKKTEAIEKLAKALKNSAKGG
jgi:hypothetical protein